VGFRLVKGDKKLDSVEIKRNVNYFAWICAIFVISSGLLISWRFFNIQEYLMAFSSFLVSLLVVYPAKALVFNIGIVRAKKKHQSLKDLLIIKINKKRFFTLSGLTIVSVLGFFICFILILVPNIDIIEAEQKIFGAHRGNSVDYIENTLLAFRDAVEEDRYKFIEFDIQYTKDKQIIVYHDSSLFKLQQKFHKIKSLTYDELLNISDFHIPLYSEVMDIVAGEKPLNIEIKSQGNLSDDQKLADYVVNDCKERGIFESTLFSSISTDVVKYFSEKYPETDRGKIYWITLSSFFDVEMATEKIYEDIEEMGANYLMIHSNNLRNYKSFKELKPEHVTVVFWYLTDDQMYIIEPKENSWIFKLGGKVISTEESIKTKCFWWC